MSGGAAEFCGPAALPVILTHDDGKSEINSSAGIEFMGASGKDIHDIGAFPHRLGRRRHPAVGGEIAPAVNEVIIHFMIGHDIVFIGVGRGIAVVAAKLPQGLAGHRFFTRPPGPIVGRIIDRPPVE